ncbi:MAG TPA: patatin-like phospholipase family protein [Burkholderiales bacterium]|jgi:NTE family protein|nr:patatin-like phospholipase family protein [Burkholderiales bacterium]
MRKKTALILTGGGARAAYQVGVVKAVDELLGRPRENPFPIVCGTSAGAINAAALAIRADNFAEAVRHLLGVWESFRVHQVYRADWPGIVRTGARWVSALLLFSRANPVALLDNTPLREMLARSMEFGRIAANIDAGALHAVAVTASGYTSGQSVTFYEGGSGLEQWERSQRVGAATPLSVELLLASSAIPFIFPAVKYHREFFGDGSMRQIAPISPALHLGADRVLVIGTGRQWQDAPRMRSTLYPSLAQIAGHALNSIFLDSLAVDIERLQRINRTLQCVAPEKAHEFGLTLRPIDVLVMHPSQPIERIAARHVHDFPPAVRFLLRAVGAMNRNGSNLASYLLFEAPFCKALINLGYADTMARRDEMLAFLGRAA